MEVRTKDELMITLYMKPPATITWDGGIPFDQLVFVLYESNPKILKSTSFLFLRKWLIVTYRIERYKTISFSLLFF